MIESTISILIFPLATKLLKNTACSRVSLTASIAHGQLCADPFAKGGYLSLAQSGIRVDIEQIQLEQVRKTLRAHDFMLR
jgi:hypothetical protein